MGLATMLLFVVVVFLLCNILPLVNNILESFYDTGVDQLVQASNFLVVLNSSVNFVIYCTCGERFRRLLFRLCRDFLVCRLGHRDSLRSSVYRKSNFYRGQHGKTQISYSFLILPKKTQNFRVKSFIFLWSNSNAGQTQIPTH